MCVTRTTTSTVLTHNPSPPLSLSLSCSLRAPSKLYYNTRLHKAHCTRAEYIHRRVYINSIPRKRYIPRATGRERVQDAAAVNIYTSYVQARKLKQKVRQASSPQRRRDIQTVRITDSPPSVRSVRANTTKTRARERQKKFPRQFFVPISPPSRSAKERKKCLLASRAQEREREDISRWARESKREP